MSSPTYYAPRQRNKVSAPGRRKDQELLHVARSLVHFVSGGMRFANALRDAALGADGKFHVAGDIWKESNWHRNWQEPHRYSEIALTDALSKDGEQARLTLIEYWSELTDPQREKEQQGEHYRALSANVMAKIKRAAPYMDIATEPGKWPASVMLSTLWLAAVTNLEFWRIGVPSKHLTEAITRVDDMVDEVHRRLEIGRERWAAGHSADPFGDPKPRPARPVEA